MDELEISSEVDAVLIARLTRPLNAEGIVPTMLCHKGDTSFCDDFAEMCGDEGGSVSAQLVPLESMADLAKPASASEALGLTAEERLSFRVVQRGPQLQADMARLWDELPSEASQDEGEALCLGLGC